MPAVRAVYAGSDAWWWDTKYDDVYPYSGEGKEGNFHLRFSDLLMSRQMSQPYYTTSAQACQEAYKRKTSVSFWMGILLNL